MKKNRKTHRTASIILVLFITFALAAYTAAGPGGPPRGAGGPLLHCSEQLTLSTETRATVEALSQTQRDSMTADRDTMKAALDTYYAALTAVPQDGAALEQAQQALIALEQKHAESRFDLEKAIVALLTNDEVSQLGDCLSSLPEPPSMPPHFGGKAKGK